MSYAAAHTALRWQHESTSWAIAASARAGADAKLQLLPTAPLHANPAWRRAPCWAASALLPNATIGSPHTLTGSQLWTNGNALTLTGRLLWSLGCHGAFFTTCTPYPYSPPRRNELLPLVLQYALSPAISDSSSSEEEGVSSTRRLTITRRRQQLLAAKQRRQAERLFRSLAADMRVGAVRWLGWMLTLAFRYLFGSELLCDAASLQRMRELQADHTLVIVATHKSHIDYLMLSYVLFAAGLPCPHIAAGANLSLPLVSRLLRACGAFFIRRSNSGADAELYKRVLEGYIHALLGQGQVVEFFIEGGRSRDGRVLNPRLGLLAYVVNSQLAGDMQKTVLLVPAAISFDRVLEERGLAAQLAGAPKKKESLWGLLSSCWDMLHNALFDRRARRLGLGAGGVCGRAAVAFGTPINLEEFLQEHMHQDELAAGSGARKEVVAALGEALTRELCIANVLSAGVLIVGTLFLHQSLPGAEETPLAADVEWLASELRVRGATVMALPVQHRDAHVRRLGTLLEGCVTAAPAEGGQVLILATGAQARLRQHMRLNQLLPWLAAEGLVTAAMLACSGPNRGPAAMEDVVQSALWLRYFLGPEIDSALGPAAFQTAGDFSLLVVGLQARGQVVVMPAAGNNGSSLMQLPPGSATNRLMFFASLLLSPLLVTYAAVVQVALALATANSSGVSSKALAAAAQAALMEEANGAGHPFIVPSTALVQGALRTLRVLAVLVPAPCQAVPPGATEGADARPPSPPVPPLADVEASGSLAAFQPVASSEAAGLCLLDRTATVAKQQQTAEDLVVVGPDFSGTEGVQALLDRLRSYLYLD